jgi:hypothetical protein
VKLRLRDRHTPELDRQPRAVSYVWNYCNDTLKHAFSTRWDWRDKVLSAGTLQKLGAGSGTELDIHSHMVKIVCETYEKSRKAKKSVGCDTVAANLLRHMQLPQLVSAALS